MIRERTIHRQLRRQAERYGDRTFFHFGDRAFSYRELDLQSDRVAAGLQELGVKKGDKVAIMMGNRPEFLFLWLGICKLGAIEVPINTAHRGVLLRYFLEQSEAVWLVVEAPFLERTLAAGQGLPLRRLVAVGEPDEISGLPDSICPWPLLLEKGGTYKEPVVLWSDPFGIMYTSGTTGPSKGALMPHNYAVYMGELVGRLARYTEEDCLYNALPLFHGNAQLLSAMPALLSGARMVLAERFSASRFWEEVTRHSCTAFNYIGGIIPILLKAEPSPRDANNPLRLMLGGGCPADLFDPMESRFGLKILEGYGMSELGLPVANTLEHRKKGTIGRVANGYQVKLVDDHGLEVPPGVPGEIIVRPEQPYTMLLEYHRMPQATVEAWHDLWFRTGDYVVRDEEGYFRFVDRKKDALRRRGENISSYEVEKIINSHPAVLESAAVAVKSDTAEDEVMICLTLRPGAALTPLELMGHCQDNMAYFMVPRYLRFMLELPKTPTLRVQKAALRGEGVTADTWDREKEGYRLRR